MPQNHPLRGLGAPGFRLGISWDILGSCQGAKKDQIHEEGHAAGQLIPHREEHLCEVFQGHVLFMKSV